MRVDGTTGRVLASASVAGGSLGSITVDPSSNDYLYVASTSGEFDKTQIVEFDAASGRRLASTSATSPVSDAVGAQLTAVSGTLWVTFRTGMNGQTVVLRQRDLAEVIPPGQGSPAVDDIYLWPMGESVLYGDGTIWVDNVGGYWACLDPHTGAVKASEHVPTGSPFAELLAVDSSGGRSMATRTTA